MRDEFVFYLISVTEQVSQRRIELKAPTTKATYLSIPINIYVYPEIIPIGMSVSVFFFCVYVCIYLLFSLQCCCELHTNYTHTPVNLFS